MSIDSFSVRRRAKGSVLGSISPKNEKKPTKPVVYLLAAETHTMQKPMTDLFLAGVKDLDETAANDDDLLRDDVHSVRPQQQQHVRVGFLPA